MSTSRWFSTRVVRYHTISLKKRQMTRAKVNNETARREVGKVPWVSAVPWPLGTTRTRARRDAPPPPRTRRARHCPHLDVLLRLAEGVESCEHSKSGELACCAQTSGGLDARRGARRLCAERLRTTARRGATAAEGCSDMKRGCKEGCEAGPWTGAEAEPEMMKKHIRTRTRPIKLVLKVSQLST